MSSLMIQYSTSSLMLQYATVRWKEWIPFVTQQQRFRNLIQIVGYNIGKDKDKEQKTEISYYYTLHLTTMCAPFYTSEKICSEHPKWSEIDFMSIDPSYGSVTGIVVRVWEHNNNVDTIVTVWGIYFSGLANVDPDIVSQGQSAFSDNALVFFMHGGCFTSSDCLQTDEPTLARVAALSMNQNDVRKSYTVDALCKLHAVQRSIKELTEEAIALHNKILMGRFPDDKSQIKENSAFLRKLLNQSKPATVSHEQILAIKSDIETKKFQIQLLQEVKSFKLSELKKRSAVRTALLKENEDEGCKLKDHYHNLNKDIINLKEWKKAFLEGRANLSVIKSQLCYSQKIRISELAYIYPIKKNTENKYTICDVHLPNSENFEGTNELSLSVALGFTAHLVQMISLVINIPLRYSVIHFGSRSKIIDHIIEEGLDNREFPLFLKGSDKRCFEYAVYLLNKNIAQLRWHCGISTSDVPATLPNLEMLLNMHTVHETFKTENKYTSDNLARLCSISRNTLRYGSSPNQLSDRKSDNFTVSLDEGSNKWQEKSRSSASTLNINEALSQDDKMSTDSI